MNANEVTTIGYAAGLCTTVSFVPQLLRVLRLKSARDISLGMFLIFSLGSAMWLLYGVLAHSIPVTLWNAITLLLALWILALKLHYDRNAMSEITSQKEKP